MQPLLHPAPRLVLLETAISSLRTIRPHGEALQKSSTSICLRCQFRAFTTRNTRQVERKWRTSIIQTSASPSKQFTTSLRYYSERQPTRDELVTRPTGTIPTSTAQASNNTSPPRVQIAPEEDLPSHKEKQK